MASYLRSLGGEIVDRPTGRIARRPSAVARRLMRRHTASIRAHRRRSTVRSASRKRLSRYRYGPGVFKMDWALSQPVPWRAEGCTPAPAHSTSAARSARSQRGERAVVARPKYTSARMYSSFSPRCSIRRARPRESIRSGRTVMCRTARRWTCASASKRRSSATRRTSVTASSRATRSSLPISNDGTRISSVVTSPAARRIFDRSSRGRSARFTRTPLHSKGSISARRPHRRALASTACAGTTPRSLRCTVHCAHNSSSRHPSRRASDQGVFLSTVNVIVLSVSGSVASSAAPAGNPFDLSRNAITSVTSLRS